MVIMLLTVAMRTVEASLYSGVCVMDFSYSPRTEEYRQRVLHFMDTYVLPHNQQWHEEVAAGEYPLALINDLEGLADYEGLWNLFLPSLRGVQPGRWLAHVQ